MTQKGTKVRFTSGSYRDQEAVVVVANDHRLAQLRQAGESLHGFLHHGKVGGQGQQLFRQGGAGQGPQAGAGTAGEDDGVEGHGAGLV